jgi:ATP-dependent protease ClpP protease subunit
MKKRKFYQITTAERVANIDIYGDITSSPYDWWTGEKTGVSAKDLKQEIDELDVDVINIYINSYGGEVAEALAIYSALKRHQAAIHTYCDGFASSAATIIFAAGDTRTMGNIALMMIHNCMSYLGYANSEEMRKAAEDNDKINQSSINAYLQITNLTEDKIKEMMNRETWLTAQECLDYGFATEIAEQEDDDDEGQAQQSAVGSIREAILNRSLQPVLESQNLEPIMKKLDEMQKSIDSLKEGNSKPFDGQEQTGNQESNFLKTMFSNIL